MDSSKTYEFKAGDRVRRVAKGAGYPVGYEANIIAMPGKDWQEVIDEDGDIRPFFPSHWELASAAGKDEGGIKWGAPVKVNGRPDWYRDGEYIKVWDAVKYRSNPDGDIEKYYWDEIETVALPADHPHYAASQPRQASPWPSPVSDSQPGLYRVWWAAGGHCEAAIGLNRDGTRWLAPVNWFEPATSDSGLVVERLERIGIETEEKKMTVDWTNPIEAVHVDGRVSPAVLRQEGNIKWVYSAETKGDRVFYYGEDGQAEWEGWTIRNVQPIPEPVYLPAGANERLHFSTGPSPELVARMVALVRLEATGEWTTGMVTEARAILAELEPDDVDDENAAALLLSMEDDGFVFANSKQAEAIALAAVKRGRELERGGGVMANFIIRFLLAMAAAAFVSIFFWLIMCFVDWDFSNPFVLPIRAFFAVAFIIFWFLAQNEDYDL